MLPLRSECSQLQQICNVKESGTYESWAFEDKDFIATQQRVYSEWCYYFIWNNCAKSINTLGLRRRQLSAISICGPEALSGIWDTTTRHPSPQFSQVILTSTDWLVMYLQLSIYITVKPHLHSSTCVIYTISFHPILLSLESVPETPNLGSFFYSYCTCLGTMQSTNHQT